MTVFQKAQAFNDHYGFSIPQTVNGSHSIIILASELDDSSERIVEYLAEQYGVPINVLFFTFFKATSGEYMGRAWLKDPEEIQERKQSRDQAPWSGFYFVNVGEGEQRNWDDGRKYGFLSAGQGEKYGNAMKKLKPGDRVFAYMKGLGASMRRQVLALMMTQQSDSFSSLAIDSVIRPSVGTLRDSGRSSVCGNEF
jgi:hypothetical protein